MTAFDLFRTTPQGTEWVGTFLKVDWAKFNAQRFAAHFPGTYFVVDQASGDKLFEVSVTNVRLPPSHIRIPRLSAVYENHV
jgi:hypothetical protein